MWIGIAVTAGIVTVVVVIVVALLLWLLNGPGPRGTPPRAGRPRH